MMAVRCSITVPLVVWLALAASVQEPTPPTSKAVLALAGRCCTPGATSTAAIAELQALLERDYPAVFAAWEQASPGPVRDSLDRALSLPTARAATTIVAGEVTAIATEQGGVIDYHRLDLHFAAPQVLRAAAAERDDLRAGYCSVLSGTHADAWLSEQLRPNLERVQGPRVWLLIAHPYRIDQGTATERTLVVQQWAVLPAAAAPCLQQLLR